MSRVLPPRGARLAFLPLLMLGCLAWGVVLDGARSPTRLLLERAFAGPSLALPLGAGDAGIDLLALAAHAIARVLVLAVGVAASGFLVGTALGTAAGLAGGRAHRALLSVCDLMQAFPSFLLALAVLAAVREPTRWHLAGVFALTAWAPFARLSAVQARALADGSVVEAARALGVGPLRTLAGHVVPLLFGPVAVQAGSAAAGVVLGEAALGFVGLGPSDGVSLGALLEQGTLAMLRAPHVLLVGALGVMATSGALQLASEGLRRWLVDPPGRQN